jgi:hypothetical protein
VWFVPSNDVWRKTPACRFPVCPSCTIPEDAAPKLTHASIVYAALGAVDVTFGTANEAPELLDAGLSVAAMYGLP